MPDLDGEALDGGGDHGQGGEVGGVTVAGDHLRGNWLDDQPHGLGHVFLDARIDAGEGADGAGNGAGGDLEAGHGQAFLGPLELGVEAGQLEAEGGRLGVDAVAAADGRRGLVLERPALQGGQHQVDVFQQQVGRAAQLHRQGGVVDVRRGHALVQEPRLRPDDLGDVGQEGDDVVLGLALDLVDALDVEDGVSAALPDRLGGQLGDHAQLRHGVGGVRLDLEHDAEPGLRRPDLRGFGPGIAGDHGPSLSAMIPQREGRGKGRGGSEAG